MLVLVLSALLGAPWRALHGAPLAELSGDQDFQLFLHKNLEFTRKIKGDVAALQRVVVSCRHRGVADKVTFPSLALSAPQGREPAASPRPNLPTPWSPPPPAPLGPAAPKGAPWGGVWGPPHALSEQRFRLVPWMLRKGWGGGPASLGGVTGVVGSSGHPDPVSPPHPQCDTFQLCKEEELLLVQQDLRITQVALEQCHRPSFQAVSASGHPCHGQPSARGGQGREFGGVQASPSTADPPRSVPCCPQEACFSQIRHGLHAYHSSLAAVLELLPSHAGLVETLQLDAANLSSNIQQQVRGHNEGGCTPRGWARGHGAPVGTGAVLRGCS